jgi:hypothetical protein
MIFLNLGLAFLLGASLAGAIFAYFFPFGFSWEYFGAIALAMAAALLFTFRKRASPPQKEFETFEKECKMAIRGHLKASILFWVHFYRKEKVKTLEDAKREIFHDLKREFSDVRWMESMLEDIRQEIARYK